ncbi:unnamed protein product [Soboliphyme baturini]|uniref:Protein YIPF3 n=1 Tax=Soboliphyme baturini TaxID=241478 RepID=A0A183IT36_9BILA|nr:unnamed protein product [Soboliphyme baturini]
MVFASANQDTDTRRRPITTNIDDEDIYSTLKGNLTHLVWEAGSTQVKQAFVTWTSIDLFRPYFDTDVVQVSRRFLFSFIPQKPEYFKKVIPGNELYGPLMLVFTLVILLHFSMKTSGYQLVSVMNSSVHV